MNLRILYLPLLVLLAMACHKDDDNIRKFDKFPLKRGNYWIYRTVITTADEQVQVFQHLDSVWIDGDTLIKGKQYAIRKSSLNMPTFWRDSADCILERNYFTGFEEIIYSTSKDTLWRWDPLSLYIITSDYNSTTKVPAGDFKTINCRMIKKMDPNSAGHSNYPAFGKNFITTQQHISSPKVGLVKHITYFIGNTSEYELVRYKLK